MCDFEKKVYDGIFGNVTDVLNKKIAVAVSGGADSVSLLISLCNIFSPLGIVVQVITVNHNIRPKKETCGDVDFVVDLCNQLKSFGKLTKCSVAQIPAGTVSECAEIRKCGIEEAARFLRYKIFSDFCLKNNIDVLFLAHNQNDNLETVLMRFLQGGNVQNLCGIPCTRELSEKTIICRPLLKIERFEIEKYLTDNNFLWRTDATNCDVKYFRNKVRLKLIPFLDNEFPEWKNAVLNSIEKNKDDCKVFDSLLEKVPFEVQKSKEKYGCNNFSDKFENFDENVNFSDFFENNTSCTSYNLVKIFLKDFLPLENSIKTRVVIKAMNMIDENRRIPYAFIKDLINSVSAAATSANNDCVFNTEKSDFATYNKICFSKKFGNVQILCKKDCIFFKKSFKNHTDLFFFDIIEKSGEFSFPFGNLIVRENEEKNVSVYINSCFCCENLSFPFIVRSAVYGDVIKMSNGDEKKVFDIFSDFHISEDDKKLIPIVQSLHSFQPIICVPGKFLGYKNWIVKNV